MEGAPADPTPATRRGEPGHRRDELLTAALRAAADPPPDPPPPIFDPITGGRNAAVLVLADPASPGLPILFIRRSRHVSSHQGQIAFPGGGAEDGDDGPVGTALREAHEEVGVDRADVEVIGVLPRATTRTSAVRVDPVLALARRALSPRPDGYEVGEIFTLRLDELLQAPLTSREIPGMAGTTVHFIEIGERVIWGATAAMLVELLARVRAASAG
jgi:8-oxo-dGTP pyrophosphatase MutT (NUDIX family)